MVLAPELALFAEAVAGQRHRHRGEEEAEVIRKRGKEISDQGGLLTRAETPNRGIFAGTKTMLKR
jgi:hypothetical protein